MVTKKPFARSHPPINSQPSTLNHPGTGWDGLGRLVGRLEPQQTPVFIGLGRRDGLTPPLAPLLAPPRPARPKPAEGGSRTKAGPLPRSYFRPPPPLPQPPFPF